MIDRHAIRQRWEADGSKRDERGRRFFAASEARAAGWGGLAAVSNITGLARSTIERGLKDLDAPPLAPGQVRREGGGPRPLTETDATLLDDLKRLVEPVTLGDPVRPLLWVSKSLDKLASALVAMGHSISPNSVRKLLTEIGFSRQVNRKADEGSGHPDRNAQFEYINAEVVVAQAAGQPVISVDTKKKELVGNYRNVGSDWRPKGAPQRVKMHDFEDKKLGKVAPYGVYDIAADAGWVSVGITCDTAEFAVASIRTWLERIGRARYPKARELRSRQIAAARTAHVCGSGKWSCKSSRTRRASRSRSGIIRQAHRNGTKSSTAYSAASRRTGAAGRSQTALPSSSSSRRQRPRPGSKLKAHSTQGSTRKASRSPRPR